LIRLISINHLKSQGTPQGRTILSCSTNRCW